MQTQETAVDGGRLEPAQVTESVAKAEVWREGEWFVARARGMEVASQGRTRTEALANLREALELHNEDPVATPPSE